MVIPPEQLKFSIKNILLMLGGIALIGACAFLLAGIMGWSIATYTYKNSEFHRDIQQAREEMERVQKLNQNQP